MSIGPGPGLFPGPSLYPGGSLAIAAGLPLPPFPMNSYALDLYARMAPLARADAANGFPLALICGAIGVMYDEVESVVRAQPGRQPYQQAWDINQAPDILLPYLGQAVGVRDLNGLTAAQQRAKISAEAGFYRGSPGAIVTAIANTLTGGQAVSLLERTSDAWTMEAVTDPAQTPSPTLTNTAAQQAKPAGTLITVVQASVPIVDQGGRAVDSGTATIDTAVITDVN